MKINKNSGDISYTENDTFKITVYPKYEGAFEEGSQLRFIIAQTEESEYIIDKTININDDLTFTITLMNNEKSKLNLGEYKYKMILIKNNTIVTQKSGYLNVEWGATEGEAEICIGGDEWSLAFINEVIKKYVDDVVGDIEKELGDGETGTTQVTPLFANSIEECTDITKLYVLPDGFIYAYMEKTEYTEAPNLFNREDVLINYRYSGSDIISKSGYYITDYISINMDLSDPIVLRFKGGKMWSGTGDKLLLFDENKTLLKTTYIYESHNNTGSIGHLVESDGDDYIIKLGYTWTGTNDIAKDDCYNDIAYIRINQQINTSGIGSSDVPDVSITIDAMGGTKTTTGWTNTGHAFVPADYEGRIIKLEGEVEAHALAISTGIGNKITIPTFWEDAVDECIAKIKALQTGKNCITFPFFSDNHQRNGYSGALIAKVMDECYIPYAFYGGDSISSGYIASEEAMIAEDKKFDSAMSYIHNGRFCRAVGNHDGFWNVSENTGDEYHYTRDKVYELFLREESIAQNKHFGDDGTYYYVDDVASKVRFIVLNTNKQYDENNTAIGDSVDSIQLSWLQNIALSFSESGWAVVFISHQPISNHYHANISNADAVRTVVKNYINGSATNKADVVGWFSGHIHRDRIYTGVATNTTDDTEGDAIGFTQVTITSDHTAIAYDDSTKHAIADDDQSHAIDFVTINKTTRTVNLTRLGIGEDRSFSY